MKIGTNAKMFFDAPKVIRATTRAESRVLFRVGGTVRKIARQSMKPGGKKDVSSRPGRPPRTHTKFLKNMIRFDVSRRSVVVGPEPYGSRVARILEEGGTTTLPTGKRVRIAARPFMGPAFAQVLPTVPAMWEGSVR